MYVAGGYLGELAGDFPTRKPPDPLYFEWQVWLLRTLHNQGHRVITKVHPKGVLREARLLEAFSDSIETGTFDPNEHQVDCYIYDFAGTAFFDSLASTTGVVLIDMGVRPFDQRAFADLAARCPIVHCQLDERNRFRADPAALREAVERAASLGAGPDEFFRRYFH